MQCPEGKWSGIGFFEICTDCDPGKFTEVSGSEKCNLCPDYMTSSSGASLCRCKDGFVSTLDTFTKQPTCSYPPGFTLENEQCVTSSPGFYKTAISLSSCSSCKSTAIKGSLSTTTPATSALSCGCSKGKYWKGGKGEKHRMERRRALAEGG